jgi:Smg protein
MTGIQMSDSVIDVLMFLFTQYMEEDSEHEPDRESLSEMLLDAGFRGSEIEKAYAWLDGLVATETAHAAPPAAGSLRVYCEAELQRLDVECRGFLLFLEQCGILTPASREVLLDRVLALEEDEPIDLEQLKWITMMVLFNQPGEEFAYAQMEDLVFDDSVAYTQ